MTQEKSNIQLHDDFYVFPCPHCNCNIQVHKNELNCRIFRHATYYTEQEKDGKKYRIPTHPINPHCPEIECQRLIEQDLILGCAKPFRIIDTPTGLEVSICSYI